MEAWYHPSHCMNDPQPEGHMASHIARRKFLATLGGAAAWPLAAHAQQAKVVRLGYLDPARRTDTIAVNLRRQFLLGMRRAGGGAVESEQPSEDRRMER